MDINAMFERPMEPDELAGAMQQIGKEHIGDYEAIHAYADDLMVKQLRLLGFDAAMNIYEKMERYCA